jgi:hypothetical protein
MNANEEVRTEGNEENEGCESYLESANEVSEQQPLSSPLCVLARDFLSISVLAQSSPWCEL